MFFAQDATGWAGEAPTHRLGSCRVGSLRFHAVYQIRHHARERRDADASAHQQQHLELLWAERRRIRVRFKTRVEFRDRVRV